MSSGLMPRREASNREGRASGSLRTVLPAERDTATDARATQFSTWRHRLPRPTANGWTRASAVCSIRAEVSQIQFLDKWQATNHLNVKIFLSDKPFQQNAFQNASYAFSP